VWSVRTRLRRNTLRTIDLRSLIYIEPIFENFTTKGRALLFSEKYHIKRLATSLNDELKSNRELYLFLLVFLFFFVSSLLFSYGTICIYGKKTFLKRDLLFLKYCSYGRASSNSLSIWFGQNPCILNAGLRVANCICLLLLTPNKIELISRRSRIPWKSMIFNAWLPLSVFSFCAN